MADLSTDQAMQLAVIHHQAGRLRDAESIYRKILEVQPQHAEALHLLGVIAGQMGRFDIAADLIGKAIAIVPGNPTYYFNRGIFLEKQEQADLAIESYKQAIACKPDYFQAEIHLGNAWRAKGNTDLALAAYERALQLAPHLPEPHISLGNIRQDRGESDLAIACFQRAIQIDPGNEQIAENLANALIAGGMALQNRGQTERAIELFRQAIHIRPIDARAHFHLANAWNARHLPDEAIASYQRAITLYQATQTNSQDLLAALCMLGSAWNKTGQVKKAIDLFREALLRDPDYALANDLLLYSLIFDPASDSAAIFAESREWNRRVAEKLKPTATACANDSKPDRRLRIGYVSADFRRHVANHFMFPLLAAHDRQAVEIFCYANVKSPDEVTAKLMALAGHWRDIAGLGDDDVAAMIRRDQIDILVDLSLHTADNRLLVFARKPAPVQATWLGYPGTTGLTSMDYRITDPHLDAPGGDESCYCEQSIRLPDTFWCYDPLGNETAVNSLPALSNERITFGCLNDFQKVNDSVLDLWARVLDATRGSRLLILAPVGSSRQRAVDRMSANGVDPHRLDFVPRQPYALYMQTYHQIDISLDTFPCNGHTTGLDSLWMGVPVVTLAGNTVAGRAGVSQLSNLGLLECIARSAEQYVQIAAGLAGDLPRLAAWRSSLRERMQVSPLMDSSRFARGIEDAYRAMWEAWCEK